MATSFPLASPLGSLGRPTFLDFDGAIGSELLNDECADRRNLLVRVEYVCHVQLSDNYRITKTISVKSICCTITGIMLKRLPIFAVAALIVSAILMAGYYQQRNAEGEGYDIKCVQDGQPSSTLASLACAIHQSQNTQQGHPKPPWWNVLFTWPEGITAWLLLLTLGAIVWQSWGTWKAADAALEGAKAANAQIKVMKDKERARITVELAPLETLEFGINHNRVMLKFTNVGATHAFNVYAEGDARVIVFEIIPAIEGPFGNVKKTLEEFRRVSSKKLEVEPLPFEVEDLVTPSIIQAETSYGETWVAFIFPEEWRDTLLLRPRIAVEVRGEIRYDDVFGENHFTKFSYDMGISKWGDVSREGSAPIRPYSPFSQWRQVGGEDGNRAT